MHAIEDEQERAGPRRREGASIAVAGLDGVALISIDRQSTVVTGILFLLS